MKEPAWLTWDIILAVQEELLSRFGGDPGLRDPGLLESALARPAQKYHYGKASLFEFAAAYACGIIKNHPFVDGNKRTGFLAAYVFLEINGVGFDAPEEDVFLKTYGLAAGKITEEAYADWLKKYSITNRKSHQNG